MKEDEWARHVTTHFRKDNFAQNFGREKPEGSTVLKIHVQM
jgi:hypothetical protein